MLPLGLRGEGVKMGRLGMLKMIVSVFEGGILDSFLGGYW